MWPGQQQPPGGEHNPQQNAQQNPYQQPGYDTSGYQQAGQQQAGQQPGHQQPNPYQQPGYQSTGFPAPYAQQQPQWGAPAPVGTPEPPVKGGGNRTKVVAIVAALAVVVTAGVTGFLVLGGGDDEKKNVSNKPAPSVSESPSESATEESRSDEDEGAKPTVEGWKVVINPKWGTAFDVPADWEVLSADTFVGFEDASKDDASAIIGMSAPAILKEKWCSVDSDKDGRDETKALARVGTKGQQGAKDTDLIARNDSAWWVFGGYTDQKEASKKLMTVGKPKPYTTASGIEGSVATSYTSGVKKKDKCDSDGKATTFAFKNSKDDYVSWTLHSAKGVEEEVPDETVDKILSTVRLYGTPTGG
ncbi:hypothetical protein SGFS_094760 [Streptomyces graminofaciens]|uniref:DUF8017 domain-containing protein n=1 Tax=Streptomyces graminofaciens TaxID=68212 RepID=A0ABM7FP60_9ACTN|nr:hypothetical protein [Streptomyces graminofaciens]BBC38182.1 hypothetical protein SGFS_094760 [Streptomyces graminofaciens]